jgi:murein DD-endopeptidase MepM/ murein hydrolase activator NlpD
LPPFQQQPFTIARFDWPVSYGKLSSGFGLRHGAMHEGVDIAVPVGTPVRAAASGRVIFAGRMRGYGKIIIIQHENHYVTVYAHDSVNLVQEGQMVSRGQEIGLVGRTGRTTGANLHFEVRHNNVASNPLLYLPPVRSTSETRLAAGPSY